MHFWESLVCALENKELMGADGGDPLGCTCGVLSIPGKPVAQNCGLLSVNNGLLWGIVAYYFRLLGVPGRFPELQAKGRNERPKL